MASFCSADVLFLAAGHETRRGQGGWHCGRCGRRLAREHHVLRPEGRGRAVCIRCGRSESAAVTLQRHPYVPAGRWPPGPASALRAGPCSRAMLEAPGWAHARAALLAQYGPHCAAAPRRKRGSGGPPVLVSAHCGRAEGKGSGAKSVEITRMWPHSPQSLFRASQVWSKSAQIRSPLAQPGRTQSNIGRNSVELSPDLVNEFCAPPPRPSGLGRLSGTRRTSARKRISRGSRADLAELCQIGPEPLKSPPLPQSGLEAPSRHLSLERPLAAKLLRDAASDFESAAPDPLTGLLLTTLGVESGNRHGVSSGSRY